jgi:hypothetical protein
LPKPKINLYQDRKLAKNIWELSVPERDSKGGTGWGCVVSLRLDVFGD